MLSMPPATTTSALPASRLSWASIRLCMPEPHILLMVVQAVAVVSPAASAACRAGAWPSPADSTQPKMLWSTALAGNLLRSTAAAIACAPSCGAVRLARLPCRPPMGVRAMPTITTGSCLFMSFDSHAQRTVEADHLAVEHAVFNNVLHQRSVFVGAAQPWRKGHAGTQAVADLFGHAGHHRGFEDARGNAHDADAGPGQFTGCRQRQAGNRALGGGIGGLPELAVKGRHRCGIDDHATLTLLVGLVVGHVRSAQAQQVEAAADVDLQYAVEQFQIMRSVTAQNA